MSLLTGARTLDEGELSPPESVKEIPATRCACDDCKDRVASPVGYWDRVIDGVVKGSA